MIPLRTDYRLRHTPWANYALIAANVLIFLLGYHGQNARIVPYMLWPDRPELEQFFSSVFLHADFMHLAGNMLFLWVFGNAVNDKFGNVGYLAFYLGGGVLAGLGYILLDGQGPALGASGAISAVTGAFLVMLPRTRVLVLIIFFYIMPVEISSLYFLAFQFAWNVFMSLRGGGGVAWWAHSSGYVFGIGVAFGVLSVKLVERDPFDLLNMLREWNRRQKYRRMVAGGYDPFSHQGGRTAFSRPVRSRSAAQKTSDTAEAKELQLRREIAEACARNDVSAAARRYIELVQIVGGAVLSKQNQLDVANQLMAEQQYPAAADAYERLLTHYPGYEHAGDIHLMLGILYGRYLHQRDRAEQALQKALDTLHEDSKIALAKADLANLRGRGA